MQPPIRIFRFDKFAPLGQDCRARLTIAIVLDLRSNDVSWFLTLIDRVYCEELAPPYATTSYPTSGKPVVASGVRS